MQYVYIIQSINFPDKIYIGYSANLKSRLEKHNTGSSIYTKNHKPWQLIFYCCFKDKSKALNFEKYLKSHSGRAFLKKRFL